MRSAAACPHVKLGREKLPAVIKPAHPFQKMKQFSKLHVHRGGRIMHDAPLP